MRLRIEIPSFNYKTSFNMSQRSADQIYKNRGLGKADTKNQVTQAANDAMCRHSAKDG